MFAFFVYLSLHENSSSLSSVVVPLLLVSLLRHSDIVKVTNHKPNTVAGIGVHHNDKHRFHQMSTTFFTAHYAWHCNMNFLIRWKSHSDFFASTITFILIRNLVIEISFKIHIKLCSWCLHTFFFLFHCQYTPEWLVILHKFLSRKSFLAPESRQQQRVW